MSYVCSLRKRSNRLLDLIEPFIPAFVTPNRLSWSRVWGVPLLWGCYVVHPFLCFAYYTALCFTDLFDGYLAKKRCLESPAGKKLDERTDKFLTGGVLALLFADQIVPLDPGAFTFWLVVILVVREGVITTLRELWPTIAEEVPSLPLAKLKTFVMMIALGFMMFLNVSEVPGIPKECWELLYLFGAGLLTLSAVFSVVSMVQYLAEFADRIRQ